MMRWWWLIAVIAVACGNDRRELPSGVGPAPLRRLSNTEYAYALRDLFPALAPALPPFPADNSLSGFDNEVAAQAPSDVRIVRYEEIANVYAAAATADNAAVSTLTGCSSWASSAEASACGLAFIRAAGTRIFRRPLATDEEARFARQFTAWTAAVDFPGAVRLTLSAMLQMPQFLYRPELEEPVAGAAIVPVAPYALASRLSFFLWESIPDDELLRAAGAGELTTEHDVRRQATRMLADPRALRLVWDFHRQWLGLDRILTEEHLVRTPDVDPAWGAATPPSALEESRRFVERSFADVGTLEDLLTSRRAWVDPEMARVYGVPGPSEPGRWEEVELAAAERAGILTRVAFLAAYSHRGGNSPPIRGNAINLRLLCQLPAPPPDGIDLSIPTAQPEDGPITNRTLFELRTGSPACQQCHVSLNGFGFAFEHYSASGAYVTTEAGLPIDSSGAITGTDVDGPFADARELSSTLADSEVVARCAARKWIQYALGRPPAPAESLLVRELGQRFVDSGGDLRALLVEIVASDTFRQRRSPSQ